MRAELDAGASWVQANRGDGRFDRTVGYTAGLRGSLKHSCIRLSQVPMEYRFHKTDRPIARAISIFGAALILVSQLIAVAHFHEGAVLHNGVAAPQISADAGLCPICQLALHSPGTMAQATTVARGAAIATTIFIVAPSRSESPVFSADRVRAPPTTL